MFGGWAVDFYAGMITRPHDDVDVAVWLDDVPRIADLLRAVGWGRARVEGEDGGTAYERGPVRLELTHLVRNGDGRIVTPLRDGEAAWPDGTFASDVRELGGVRTYLVALDALVGSKSWRRGDPEDEAKDRADLRSLERLPRSV